MPYSNQKSLPGKTNRHIHANTYTNIRTGCVCMFANETMSICSQLKTYSKHSSSFSINERSHRIHFVLSGDGAVEQNVHQFTEDGRQAFPRVDRACLRVAELL